MSTPPTTFALLDTNELNYMLMLVGKQRRKREKEREKAVTKGDPATQERFLARHDRDSEWVRAVEDHLILIIANLDLTLLHDHHRERLAELTKDARRCPSCDSPAPPHLHPAVQHEGEAQPCNHPWHEQATNRSRATA